MAEYDLQELYKALEQIPGQHGTRDWAAMQALARRLEEDEGLKAIAQKIGTRPIVEAVIQNMTAYFPTDGFTPHFIVPGIGFELIENAVVIKLPVSKLD